MDYTFYREKIADSFKEKYKVEKPNDLGLFYDLKEELFNNFNLLPLIFNKETRKMYLRETEQEIPKHMSEISQRQEIGTRLCVNFLQLTMDMCKLQNADFRHLKIKTSTESIQKTFRDSIDSLTPEDTSSLSGILGGVFELMNKLLLNKHNLLEERKKIEEEEGSFFNGKRVFDK